MEFNAISPFVSGDFARMLSSCDIKRGATRSLRRACSAGARPATVFIVDPAAISPCLHAPSQATMNAIATYLVVVQEQIFNYLVDESATVKTLFEMGCARKSSDFWKFNRRNYFGFWEGMLFTPETLEALIDKVGAKEVIHYLGFYSDVLYTRLETLQRQIAADWSLAEGKDALQVDFATSILQLTDAQLADWADVRDTYLQSKKAWLTKKKG